MVRCLLASLAVVLLTPALASASLAGEQRDGAALVARLQSGATSCADLSAEDFDHIGEYAMGRALASTSAHQAMNDRMTLMLGARGEQRMHELMGQRYAGCPSGSSGAGTVMGPGMMGRSQGAGGWRSMMGSGAWSWMMDDRWRSMSRGDWQQLERRWLGTSATVDHGWSPWTIAGLGVGAALLAALGVFTGMRLASRRRGPVAPR